MERHVAVVAAQEWRGQTTHTHTSEISRHVRAPILAANRAHKAVSYTTLLPSVGLKTRKQVTLRTLQRAGKEQLAVNSRTTRKRTRDESECTHACDDVLAQAVEGLDRYPVTLVLDRAGIHTNIDAIRQAFHDRGSESIKDILLMPRPPNAAKCLSPLDNSIFHDWKEEVRKHTPATKENIVHEFFFFL
jgi:hypothetical protein